MVKTGAAATNRLPRTNASSKVGKGRRKAKDPACKGGSHQRSAETIRRLKQYVTGKPIRNREGKIVAGSLMMRDRAGDQAITAVTGRIQPDRKWFGNTRTVDPTELDVFRESMTAAAADPYSVVLRRKKVPMGLLHDAAEYTAGNKRAAALLDQEPFEEAFGKKCQRKRVKLDQLFISRSVDDVDKKKTNKSSNNNNNNKLSGEGKAETVPAWQVVQSVEADNNNNNNDKPSDDPTDGYQVLFQSAQKSQETYETLNALPGMVPWGRDSQLQLTGEGTDWHAAKKDDLFLKGQSKRIWGEFFKVLDCSDVLLHVIDARNVPGTRCTMIERHVQDHAKHKHLVFVLNKIDLVPNWVAKRWMGELAAVRPTIAFHASATHAFGKGALISLLRQFGKLHADKKQISVGVIGYPNVGKSSVINTLLSQKSCKVAPIPGETKIWQYVTLFSRIALIDCPGVVVDTAGDTEEDSVLKGVVRAERLEHPQDFCQAIIDRVKREHINAQYKLTRNYAQPTHSVTNSKNKKKNRRDDQQDDNDSDNEPQQQQQKNKNKTVKTVQTDLSDWTTAEELLQNMALRAGRLRKGGDPCLRSSAITLINDFQRGRLPHFVPPPELKKQETTTTATATATTTAADDNNNNIVAEQTSSQKQEEAVDKDIGVHQDMDQVGEEFMKQQGEEHAVDETDKDSGKRPTGKRKANDNADDEDDDDDCEGEEVFQSNSKGNSVDYVTSEDTHKASKKKKARKPIPETKEKKQKSLSSTKKDTKKPSVKAAAATEQLIDDGDWEE